MEMGGKAFEQINKQVQNFVKVGLFKKNCRIRIVCVASKADIGAVLQQQDKIGRRPIQFAFRFSTPLEGKDSIIELELLGVVWAVEHFKIYLFGVKFEIMSVHEASANVSKRNKTTKIFKQ